LIALHYENKIVDGQYKKTTAVSSEDSNIKV